MEEKVREILQESRAVLDESLAEVPGKVAAIAGELIRTFEQGGKVLICGNGGSATDAQHMACELVVKLNKERGAFPAIALTTDGAVITAQANDIGFETVFSRQIEALGKPGDMLVAISTSGESPDVLEAVSAARKAGMRIAALTGKEGGHLASLSDIAVMVPSASVQRIQEMHATIIHALCDIVEGELY